MSSPKLFLGHKQSVGYSLFGLGERFPFSAGQVSIFNIKTLLLITLFENSHLIITIYHQNFLLGHKQDMRYSHLILKPYHRSHRLKIATL